MSKTYVFLSTIETSQVATDKREVYWPKSLGSRDYYEPSLRRTFSSKSQMRRYMAAHGLRDAGEQINPDKHIQGRERSRPNPMTAAARAYVASHGGTAGLLQRIQERKGHFL